jgi:hypothetical protein
LRLISMEFCAAGRHTSLDRRGTQRNPGQTAY